MIKLTQFKLKVDDEMDVLGEYEGNESSGKVVVFSHGFGVNREARGLFTNLGNVLRNDFLIIRFDYNQILESGSMKALNYTSQSKKLNCVLQFVVKSFSPKQINIVAHSMGAIIAGMKIPAIKTSKIILNACPLKPPYERFMLYFSKRKGTILNENGTSKIERSDGSITYIGKDFWPEIKTVNPYVLYRRLTQSSQVYYVKAGKDETVTDKIKLPEGIKFFEIPGDHDFTGEYRIAWVNLCKSILEDTINI